MAGRDNYCAQGLMFYLAPFSGRPIGMAVRIARAFPPPREFRIRISDLFATTTAIAGYLSLSKANTLNIAIALTGVICFSLLCLLASPSRVHTDKEGCRWLRFPWLILAAGFVLSIVGAVVSFSTSPQIVSAIFVDPMYHGLSHDFEYEVVFLVAVISIFLGIPAVFLAGAFGAKCTVRFGLHGIGKYTVGFTVAITPLIAGILAAAIYVWTRGG